MTIRSSLFILATVIALSGCTASRHKVIAATSTVIGIEVAQSPANQSPQAKIGYNRAELAIVPTNRDDEPQSGNKSGGASDVPDVLMELKYQGLMGGTNSGIYQRLAVGSNAVTQPGAWLMFLKNANGEVSQENARALEAAMDKVPSATASQDLADLARGFAAASPANVSQYNTAAQGAGFSDFQAFLRSNPTAEQVAKVRTNFLSGS